MLVPGREPVLALVPEPVRAQALVWEQAVATVRETAPVWSALRSHRP